LSITDWNHWCTKKYYRIKNNTMPMLTIILESTTGRIITTQSRQLNDTSTSSLVKNKLRGSDRGLKEAIPFDEPFSTWGSEGFLVLMTTWQFFSNSREYGNGPLSTNKYPILIAPRFAFQFSSSMEFSDTILLREYIKIPKSEFHKLGKISFDFWDPRAN
jgi:hypothetical protein